MPRRVSRPAPPETEMPAELKVFDADDWPRRESRTDCEMTLEAREEIHRRYVAPRAWRAARLEWLRHAANPPP